MRLWLIMMLASGVTLGGSGCAQLLLGGITAAQALQPISDEQEVQIGTAAMQELLADPKTRRYTGTALNQYVTRIGQGLAADTGRASLPWEFFILESPDLNAFALPGGKIAITTGALAAMRNEAELAAVLAHEIAHVVERHGIEQLKRAMVARGVAIAALGTSPQVAQVAGSLALQIVLNGYGRDAELEADRAGVVLASENRYDPNALGGFLETLAQRSGETPGWLVPLSTHPPISERLAQIRETIRERQLSGSVTEAEEFRRMTAPLGRPGG